MFFQRVDRYNLVIYYGRETQLIAAPGLNHTTSVILSAMTPLTNMGYNLYTDYFYTSPMVAVELMMSLQT